MTHIRTLADGLRRQYGTSDPFALCERLGIAVLFTDLPQITKGFFFVLRDQPIINLNQTLAEEEKAAVCAHELGHALLHPTSNSPFLASNTNLILGRFEREADYFSACLLLDDSVEPHGECTLQQLAWEHHLPVRVVQLWAQINSGMERSF